MIQLTNITKEFGQKLAVRDVSFTAGTGEIIGFLGPNGAGKTTTMRLLLGILTPTRGSVKVLGRNPGENRVGVVRDTGYLPENNPLYPEMKVREYLGFIAGVRRKPIPEDLAANVGIDDVLDVRIEELSRGYKQRVGLAAALIGDPKLIILDEPTSGLDPIEQDRIKNLIRTVAKDKTVIFSTHILSEVEDIASRLIIINRGEIVYDGKKPAGKGSVEKLFKQLVRKEKK
ncbi:MAG: ABC transporter ATP-binding protein [Patescibacteria group bacterium]|nr:ABC transporter ATP-binding protein [Patescibacteria group bacterium]